MSREPRRRHLRHSEMDGLDRGRLDRVQANYADFGVDAVNESHAFAATNATNLITINASMTEAKAAGTAVVLTNSGGALPAPLQKGTFYYLLVSDAGAREYQLAAAPGGAAIPLTDDGTGTHAIGFPYVKGYPK